MRGGGGGGQSANGHELSYLLLAGIVGVGLFYLWSVYAPEVYKALLALASLEALPIAAIDPDMARYREFIEAQNPYEMEFMEMIGILDHVGRWYSVPAILAVVFIGVKGWNASVRERFRRVLSMKTLLENNSKLYPCIAPILNWGRSLLKEDMDSGPWMTARQPIQLAASNGLLVDAENGKKIPSSKLLGTNGIGDPDSPVIAGTITARLDRDAATRLMCGSFGPEFKGLQQLPSYLYALAAAFMFFGTGKKDIGQKILDGMSVSFRPPVPSKPLRFDRHWPFIHAPLKGKRGYSISWDGKLTDYNRVRKVWESEEVQRVVRPHNRYANLVILALYAFARRKGVISCAEFIWLRPVNRNLFYLLNNYGRRTVWPEIAGPWCHFQAENALCNVEPDFEGLRIASDMKQVETAVNALEYALYEEGWILAENMSFQAKKGRFDFDAKSSK